MAKNLEFLCRACMQELAEDVLATDKFDIFHTPNLLSQYQSICKLSTAMPMYMQEHDGLPRHICCECYKKVLDINEFAQQCEDSWLTLDQLSKEMQQERKQKPKRRKKGNEAASCLENQAPNVLTKFGKLPTVDEAPKLLTELRKLSTDDEAYPPLPTLFNQKTVAKEPQPNFIVQHEEDFNENSDDASVIDINLDEHIENVAVKGAAATTSNRTKLSNLKQVKNLGAFLVIF